MKTTKEPIRGSQRQGTPSTVVWLSEGGSQGRLFGGFGVGGAFIEVDRLRWLDVSVAGVRSVSVIGAPGADRDVAVNELLADHLDTYPAATVVHLPYSELVSKTTALSRRTRLPGVHHDPEIVVHEIPSDSVNFMLDNETAYLASAGPDVGISSILVTTSDRLRSSRFESALRVGTTVMLVVPRIDSSTDPTRAIAAALDGGVLSPEGITEVIGGAPVEWVRSWEQGGARG